MIITPEPPRSGFELILFKALQEMIYRVSEGECYGEMSSLMQEIDNTVRESTQMTVQIQ